MLFRRHITASQRSQRFQTAGWRCFYFFFGNYNIGTLWFFYFLSEDAKTKKSICNNCRPKSLLLSFMHNYSVTFRHYIIILIYAALWWLHSSSFAGRVQLLWRQQLQGEKVEKKNSPIDVLRVWQDFVVAICAGPSRFIPRVYYNILCICNSNN